MKNWTSNLDAIQLGLYEKALPVSLTWEERLLASKKAGFDFVEMSIDEKPFRLERLDWNQEKRRQLRSVCESTGMPLQSLSLSAHRGTPLGSRQKSTRLEAIDILLKAIDFSLDTGIRYILLSGADIYYEESDEQTEEWFLEGLAKGVEYASSVGMMLALENWDIRIDSLTKTMNYVDHFNNPWFQVYADIGNLIFAEKDVLSELETARGHIAALHIKDTEVGQLRYVPPGEGQVPFKDVFAKLAEIGFQGPAVLELWTEDHPQAFEVVADAYKWVSAKMEQGWRSQKEIAKFG